MTNIKDRCESCGKLLFHPSLHPATNVCSCWKPAIYVNKETNDQDVMINEMRRQIKEARCALEEIMRGMTTDINKVEEMTKFRAWQALQELRPIKDNK